MRAQTSAITLYIAIIALALAGLIGNLWIPGWALVLIIALVCVGGVILKPTPESHISLAQLRQNTLLELRGMSYEELEKQTFQYESEYFKFIGESHPAVVRFREIVDAKDAFSLNKEWDKLERAFLSLERKAGHRGRPLIFEYYFWYDLNIQVLMEHGSH